MVNVPQHPEEHPETDSTELPAGAAQGIREILGSPLVPKIRAYLDRCARAKPQELAVLEGDSVALLRECPDDDGGRALKDVLRMAKTFLISRQGVTRVIASQGEWRPVMDMYERQDGWQSALGSWNLGKLDSQFAGSLPPDAQTVFLRQSLEAFLRSAERGTRQLPIAMPVSGANIDLSYLQTPEQRGTPMTDVIAPPHRLISALGATTAYAEKEEGNDAEVQRLLAIVDEHQAAGAEKFAKAPFLRLNLEISKHIADVTVRETGDEDALREYLVAVAQEPSLDAFKKTEWSAHACGLLALTTGQRTYADQCMKFLENIRAARPDFMAIIAIEPTFKELAKRVPGIRTRLDEMLALRQ